MINLIPAEAGTACMGIVGTAGKQFLPGGAGGGA